jgi:hypothetical protein
MLKMLKGLFFVHVFNDPLIRYSIKNYISWVTILSKGKVTLDTLKIVDKINKLQSEWQDYLHHGIISEFYELMLANRIYSRFESCDWTKPMWYEIMKLHIDQICEVQESFSSEACPLTDEMFGVKAYIKST